MYDRDGHDWDWGTWLGMGLMMAVLTAMVVAAVVLVVRATTGPQKTTTSLLPGTPRDTPRDSAAQRVLRALRSRRHRRRRVRRPPGPALRTPVSHTLFGG